MDPNPSNYPAGIWEGLQGAIAVRAGLTPEQTLTLGAQDRGQMQKRGMWMGGWVSQVDKVSVCIGTEIILPTGTTSAKGISLMGLCKWIWDLTPFCQLAFWLLNKHSFIIKVIIRVARFSKWNYKYCTRFLLKIHYSSFIWNRNLTVYPTFDLTSLVVIKWKSEFFLKLGKHDYISSKK